ncbi:hypothetical protein ABTZ21_36170 [Streptomyces sp. NPDC096191]|uniref:hypothetical protein n=1 Tax=Streptomyces sp. NPDC096191 TaxID=3155426 RepID=UPI003332AC68
MVDRRTETVMRARRASALRNLGRSIGEGLAWTGLGFYGTHPPHPWTGYVIPPAEQPYLPPLSEEEFVRWTAPVKHL